MQCFSMGCRWYYRRCRCRLMTDSYKFWEIMAARGITQDIFEQNAMGEDEKHQLKTWIQGLADHRGRTLYKAEIKMNKAGRRTSAEICTRCNCHTIGGLRWFYSQCSGRIAADSLCFWKAVPPQSFLRAILVQKRVAQLKAWSFARLPSLSPPCCCGYASLAPSHLQTPG